MHRVGAGARRRGDDLLSAQVRLDPHRLVGLAHERRIRIGLRIGGDGRDPEPAARAEDPPRDLPAVRHEQLPDQ
jgi:hypothetical protein